MTSRLAFLKQRRWWVGRVLVPVLCAGGMTFLVAALQSMSVESGLSALERQALGWMLLNRPSRPADPRIAFVAVDTPLYEATEAHALPPDTPPGSKPLAAYHVPVTEKDRDRPCEFPVPRRCYALAIRRLHRWGAKAVVLDIRFTRRAYAESDEREDEELGEALFAAGNVAVAAGMEPLALDRTRDPTRTADVVLFDPIPAVAENVFGNVGSPKVDPRDEEYAVELWQTAHGRDGRLVEYFALPYLAYCIATGHEPARLAPWRGRMVDGTMPRLLGNLFSQGAGAARPATEGRQPTESVELIVQGENVTVDEAFYQKRLLINFATGADPSVGRFRPARLSWLLTCTEEEGRRRFGGKIVLVGDPATDTHRTVVGALPGTEVLANAVQTLLEDRPIVPARRERILLLTFAASLAATLAIRRLAIGLALLFVAAIVAGLAFFSLHMIRHDVWFLVVTPIASVAGASVLALAFASRTVQSLVARLIPARVSRVIEQAGGFRVEDGSVLFSDIRGYSTFSEFMDPAEIMSLLNAYFEGVHEILDRHGGHFMKSPGDCVVAWFAEEERGQHHAERAVRAALELVENVDRFRSRVPPDLAESFGIGVGINTGPMAVGMLDTRRHLEPTVIGDTVNLASRLESLTKEYRVPIVISEETLDPVRDRFLYEPLGETLVKGRSQPVRIYTVHGVAPGAVEERPLPWWRRGGRRAAATPATNGANGRVDPARDGPDSAPADSRESKEESRASSEELQRRR